MKRIGIFTKMDMVGGSEFRAAEMAAAISQLPGYQSVLMAEKSIPSRLKAVAGPDVELREGIFSKPDVEALYSVQHLLIINSDSRGFTTEAYWQGTSPAHSHKIDLSRIPQMTFLFNFIVSPSSELPRLKLHVSDIRIITANSKFFDEISQQERYAAVRHYPRLQLESPINPNVGTAKTPSTRLRLGMHSLPASSKWNAEFSDLVDALNERHEDRIVWDLMGMPRQLRSTIRASNVIFRREFSIPVAEYLSGIDVFVFFLSWKREEPWSRAAGEALSSGCPVITTARGGNKNQVVHGNTGFLCKTLNDFVVACSKLIEDAELLSAMRRNAKSFARQFMSTTVAHRFLDFVQ